MNIKDLKAQDFRVFVEHYRRSTKENCLLPLKYFRITKSQKDICSNGGMTVIVAKKQGKGTATSVARCSNVDPFQRKVGLEIATKRLEEQLKIQNLI